MRAGRAPSMAARLAPLLGWVGGKAWLSAGYRTYTTENGLVSPPKQTTSGMPRQILYPFRQRWLRSKMTRFGCAILPYLTFQPKYTF
jgi:hypothetical protein